MITESGTHPYLHAKSSFIRFDIEICFPLITSDLLHNTIHFAKEVTAVSENDIPIMRESRKALLFLEKKTWIKGYGNEDLDVLMRCY